MFQTVFAEKLPQIRQILHTHRVKTAYAFGSVCTDQFNEDSDIDLLVSFGEIPFGEYAENYWPLEETAKAD